jgi:hypothetical protein
VRHNKIFRCAKYEASEIEGNPHNLHDHKLSMETILKQGYEVALKAFQLFAIIRCYGVSYN